VINLRLIELMDDQHALNTLRADFDPLTGTELEAYLIDWLETLIARDPDGTLANVADEYSIEPDTLKDFAEKIIGDLPTTSAILSVLLDRDIESPEQLTAQLDRADKFYTIAEDAGDVFTRLAQLSETTL